MWSAVRWHRGYIYIYIYMYQRINDCYVFFIAIYNNHKWALVARYWWYKISWWKLMWNPRCNSMWKGIHTEPSHFRVFKFLGKLRKWICWKTTQNPWWKTMEKHWWKTMETPCQRHRKKRWNIMQHYFGRKPMDTPWWKTMEHSDWETHGKLLVENNGKALVDNKGKPLLENCRQNDGKLGIWQHLVGSHGETISTDFWLGACRYPCTMRQVTSGYWHSSIGSLPTAVSSAGACLCFEHATPIAWHFLARFSQPVQTFGSAMLRGVGAWQPQKSIGSTVNKSNHDYLWATLAPCDFWRRTHCSRRLHCILMAELLIRPCVEEWGPNSPKKTYVRIGSNNYGFCRWGKVCPLSHRKTVGRPCAMSLLEPS